MLLSFNVCCSMIVRKRICCLYSPAEAAKKQWAQIRDLAQIQIGGSVDPHDPWVYKGPYGEIAEEEMNVLGLHGHAWGGGWGAGRVGPEGDEERVEPSRELRRRSGRRRRNAVK